MDFCIRKIGIMKNILIVLFTAFSLAALSQGSISGLITDQKTGEALMGATVKIKGTTQGATTDLEGIYKINNVKAGKYTLLVSYISYNNDSQVVTLTEGQELKVNFKMTEYVKELAGGKEVVVTGTKKTNSEKAIINEIRSSNAVVSAVSAEQISKTPDRDAAEVVKRIPGVTIQDNRFIIVRGLNERYNSVWVNGVGSPSVEADKKSFSFDVIPSAMIDKLMIYKTPSAELPGDFAGGMVKISTRSFADKKIFNVNASTGYRMGNTFSQYYYNDRMSSDLLGFSNKKRDLPFDNIQGNSIEERKEFSKQLRNNWGLDSGIVLPETRLSVTYANVHNIGNSRLSYISNIGYSNATTNFSIFRADYDDTSKQRETLDMQASNQTKFSGLQNISFLINDNNKIEANVLFNQFGRNQTVTRTSTLYNAPNEKSYMYGFDNRSIFSSQLNGKHGNSKNSDEYTWNLGFANTKRGTPDLRRIKYTKQQEAPDSMYSAGIPSGSPSPEFGVRFYSELTEKIYSFGQNYRHTFDFEAFDFEINAGSYLEYKDRVFDARLLGYVINPGFTAFNYRRIPVDRIFSEEYVGTKNGFYLDEITEPNYAYQAQNQLIAGYLTANATFFHRLKVVAGARYENNIQMLQSYLDLNRIEPSVPTQFILPSANVSYNFNEKSLIRAAYGKTVNRPEFREWSPFKFYDFDFNADIYGSLFKSVLPKSGQVLETCTIDNLDLRYEFYPSNGEMIHIGAFYKNFINPIEQYILPSSNRLFTFANAASAYSYGLELDLKKNLGSISSKLKNFNLVANTSFIKSQIKLDFAFNQSLTRPLQGQSPYVINTGIYYNNDQKELQVTALYNVVGPRIFLVGTNDYASWGELSKNNIDLSVTKKIANRLSLNIQIQDILNQPVWVVQDTNQDDKFSRKGEDLTIMKYKRGQFFNLGIRYAL